MLVNALVHRSYTQRGDIFLSLHPDRLEVVNPGRLPLGVTPGNILHASRRRNDGLARVFHDLGLMEREGSGFDLMYDRMLSTGRPVPVLSEGPNSVCVTIFRRIVRPQVIRLMEEADTDKKFHLTQRERISLGVLAQSEGMTAKELSHLLELGGVDSAAVEVLDLSDYRPRKIPSLSWQECSKKVWEIDPLACPKYGGEMKVISFITEAVIIRRILEHLGLWAGKMPPPSPLPNRNLLRPCQDYGVVLHHLFPCYC